MGLIMHERKTFRREIISETKQLVFRMGTRKEESKRCEVCRDSSMMFLPETLSDVLGISTREVYRKIEADGVHFVEIKEKQVLVCRRSMRTAGLSGKE